MLPNGTPEDNGKHDTIWWQKHTNAIKLVKLFFILFPLETNFWKKNLGFCHKKNIFIYKKAEKTENKHFLF